MLHQLGQAPRQFGAVLHGLDRRINRATTVVAKHNEKRRAEKLTAYSKLAMPSHRQSYRRRARRRDRRVPNRRRIRARCANRRSLEFRHTDFDRRPSTAFHAEVMALHDALDITFVAFFQPVPAPRREKERVCGLGVSPAAKSAPPGKGHTGGRAADKFKKAAPRINRRVVQGGIPQMAHIIFPASIFNQARRMASQLRRSAG